MGGAYGHMNHPFDLDLVRTGPDLLRFFNSVLDSIAQQPAVLKFDGVNASVKVVTYDGRKQFAGDRGSSAEIDVSGITRDRVQERWTAKDGTPRSHGMVPAYEKVLDIFNASIPLIRPELERLGLWNNPARYFNIEYAEVSEEMKKTNVVEYSNSYIAIHGVAQFYEKKGTGRRDKYGRPGFDSIDRPGLPRPIMKDRQGNPVLVKRTGRAKLVSDKAIAVPFDQSILDTLVEKMRPVAERYGFNVYSSVPTKYAGDAGREGVEGEFQKVLNTPFPLCIDDAHCPVVYTLGEWLQKANNPLGVPPGGIDLKIKAAPADPLNKDIYLHGRSQKNLADLLDEKYFILDDEGNSTGELDPKQFVSYGGRQVPVIRPMVDAVVFWEVIKNLGAALKRSLTSADFGDVANQEGIVIRDKRFGSTTVTDPETGQTYEMPLDVKVTGDFIIQGLDTQFGRVAEGRIAAEEETEVGDAAEEVVCNAIVGGAGVVYPGGRFEGENPHRGYRHHGIDIWADRGTPVYAAASGVVTYSGKIKGYGEVVAITLSNGLRNVYAHLDRRDVRKGDQVKGCDQVGTVGSTAYGKCGKNFCNEKPHLHFEVILDKGGISRDRRRAEPIKWLASIGSSVATSPEIVDNRGGWKGDLAKFEKRDLINYMGEDAVAQMDAYVESPPPPKQESDFLTLIDTTIEKIPSEEGQILVKVLDPTGVTMWPDVSRAFDAAEKDPTSSNVFMFALTALATVPVLGGKIGLLRTLGAGARGVKGAKKARAVRAAKAVQKRVVDTLKMGYRGAKFLGLSVLTGALLNLIRDISKEDAEEITVKDAEGPGGERGEDVRPPKIALFPGSFKPPHLGHLNTAEQLLDDHEVDEVVVLVSNPRKKLKSGKPNPSVRTIAPGISLDGAAAKGIWALFRESLPLGDKLEIMVSSQPSSFGAALEYVQLPEDEGGPPENATIIFGCGEKQDATGVSDTARFTAVDTIRDKGLARPDLTITSRGCETSRKHSAEYLDLLQASEEIIGGYPHKTAAAEADKEYHAGDFRYLLGLYFNPSTSSETAATIKTLLGDFVPEPKEDIVDSILELLGNVKRESEKAAALSESKKKQLSLDYLYSLVEATIDEISAAGGGTGGVGATQGSPSLIRQATPNKPEKKRKTKRKQPEVKNSLTMETLEDIILNIIEDRVHSTNTNTT